MRSHLSTRTKVLQQGAAVADSAVARQDGGNAAGKLLCGYLFSLCAVLMLSACASQIPATIVSMPTTVRPQPQIVAPQRNGSIYQAASNRALFEDRIARQVGDNLVVLIEESINASSTSANKAERTSGNSTKVSADANTGIFKSGLAGLGLGLDSSLKMDGKGSTSASNTFRGQITVQVVEVLANGNLLIAGEKQVNIRGEISYLRISGIVNPPDIKAGNVLSSTRIAEARIEEMGSGTVAAADKAGWLQNFFFSFLPF